MLRQACQRSITLVVLAGVRYGHTYGRGNSGTSCSSGSVQVVGQIHDSTLQVILKLRLRVCANVKHKPTRCLSLVQAKR